MKYFFQVIDDIGLREICLNLVFICRVLYLFDDVGKYMTQKN